jgi:hypothetical protein
MSNSDRNNNDIYNSFRQVFISQKNSGYLFELIVTKTLRNNPSFQGSLFTHIHTYKENMIKVQDMIYQDYFTSIYNNKIQSGNLDLEDILIELNKLTVSKFEYILNQDLHNKASQRSTQQTPQQTPQQAPQQVPQQAPQQAQVVQAPEQIHNEAPQALQRGGSDIVQNTKFLSKEFFSEDAIFADGKYKFPLRLKKLLSVNIDNISIKCNLYNITEQNNKFYLLEQDNKILVSIPIGNYDLTSLLTNISDAMNDVSINANKGYIYKVFNNRFKNKVCFLCDLVDKEKITRPVTFGLTFTNMRNSQMPLYKMLGFNKTEYTGNSLYIAEEFHNINIYDEFYIKCYIDGKELRKYETSGKDFTFFEKINLDIQQDFGKRICFSFENPIDIISDITTTRDFSIQFSGDYTSYIPYPIWFKCVVTFIYE